jgi:hypothetical protein
MGLTFLICLSTVALAHDEPSLSEFFAVQENKEKFEALRDTGAIQKVRDRMISTCRTWNTGKRDLEQLCECAKEQVSKLSDEMLFYTSTLAFNRYRAKVEALEKGDTAKFELLMERFAESPLTAIEIEARCAGH